MQDAGATEEDKQRRSSSSSDGAGVVLTLVEPDARVKVEVVLRLRDLLAHAHPGKG